MSRLWSWAVFLWGRTDRFNFFPMSRFCLGGFYSGAMADIFLILYGYKYIHSLKAMLSIVFYSRGWFRASGSHVGRL